MLAWFITTKIGRWVAGVAAGLVVVAGILWRVFAAGKRAERVKQDRASLENLRNRSKTDDEINAMPADTRRGRLSKWVSDER